MWDEHWGDVSVTDFKGLTGTHGVRTPLRFARTRKCLDGIVENIGEAFSKTVHRIGRTVHVDRRVGAIREGTDVVDPVDVIGVIVREQYCVHTAHARGDELQPQFWRSVDEDVCASFRLHESADPRPLVASIR